MAKASIKTTELSDIHVNTLDAYKCNYTLKHNGTFYEAGDIVELTADEAKSLVDSGVVVIEPKRAK